MKECDELKKVILSGLQNGQCMGTVCLHALIDRATVYRWMKKDRAFGLDVFLVRFKRQVEGLKCLEKRFEKKMGKKYTNKHFPQFSRLKK